MTVSLKGYQGFQRLLPQNPWANSKIYIVDLHQTKIGQNAPSCTSQGVLLSVNVVYDCSTQLRLLSPMSLSGQFPCLSSLSTFWWDTGLLNWDPFFAICGFRWTILSVWFHSLLFS